MTVWFEKEADMYGDEDRLRQNMVRVFFGSFLSVVKEEGSKDSLAN